VKSWIVSREKLAHAALLLAVFLLPWQTRWIFLSVPLQGQPWEYGQLSLYATECLLVLAWLLFGRLRLSDPTRRLIRPALFLLAACLFSGAFSVNPIVSAGAMIHVASAFLLFFLLVDERVRTNQVLAAFVSGLVVPCLAGWWQTFTGMSPASTLFGLASHLAATPGVSVVGLPDGTRLLRAYGSFPHPNVFGGYLVAGLLAAGAWFSRMKRGREWLVLPAMLFGATLVITFSRSAWIALGVAAFLLLLRRRKPSKDAKLAVFGVVIAIAATAFLFRDALLTRTSDATRLETASIAEREAGYGEFFDVFGQNPSTGVGIGAYTAALAVAHPGGQAFDYQPIHDAFLLFLGETGILGLIAALWLVGAYVRALPRTFAALPVLLPLLTLALFDHYLWSLWSGLALVALMLAFAIRKAS
jgi:O-antigen ligase